MSTKADPTEGFSVSDYCGAEYVIGPRETPSTPHHCAACGTWSSDVDCHKCTCHQCPMERSWWAQRLRWKRRLDLVY